MENISFLFFPSLTGLVLITILFVKSDKSKTEKIYMSSKKSEFVFYPRDIHLRDDAFHGSKTSRYTEWWYFDTVLNDGYSVQLSVRLISLLRQFLGLAVLRLDIYKDGNLKTHNKKIYPLNNLHLNTDAPLIKAAGKQIMKGYINETSGKWTYDLSFNINDKSADLRFIGTTKGWKGTNPGGDGWGVILPRAEVSGKIEIGKKKIKVNGIGYHDHNWNVKTAAVFNLGWFWGKIYSNNYTIVWATIFKTGSLGQPLLVVNKKNQDYFNIKPGNIQFIAKEIYKENGKEIPHSFFITAQTKNVSIHVAMDVEKIHHVKMLLIMNYWRYHVKCKGSITIDSRSESIDEMHIAEFLKFG